MDEQRLAQRVAEGFAPKRMTCLDHLNQNTPLFVLRILGERQILESPLEEIHVGNMNVDLS